MSAVGVTILRVIIWISLLGALVLQGVIVMAGLLDQAGIPTFAIVILSLGVLGILALQVIGVCILRLLGLVRHGRVFSQRSFHYVDVIIGAIGACSVLVLAFALVGVWANRTTPGDEMAPGMVGALCGCALVIAGVALVVYVQRQLLVQATLTAEQARSLRAELDEVI